MPEIQSRKTKQLLRRLLQLAILPAFASAACGKEARAINEPVEEVGPEAVSLVKSCTVPGLPNVGNLRIVADVTYLDVNGQQVQLDAAWRPDLSGRGRGVAIFVHGGAWREGSRRDYAVEMLQAAQLGYLAVSIDYRLTPAVRFPVPVQDARCAIRFSKALAGEVAFDSSRVMLIGVSAGAQISLVASDEQSSATAACPKLASSDHVTAIASLSGAYDLRQNAMPTSELQQAVTAYLGASPGNVPQIAAAASPIAALSSSTVPTLLIHGESDVVIPVSQAMQYRSALAARGIRGTIVKIPGANHYFTPFDSSAQFRTPTCTLLAYMQQELGAKQ